MGKLKYHLCIWQISGEAQPHTNHALHGHQSELLKSLNKLKERKYMSTHILYYLSLCVLLSLSNTLRHIPPHFLRAGSGGFEAIWRLLFYWWFLSNMKPFFSHLTTHIRTASGLSFRMHTDSQKQGAGVSSTGPASHVRSCLNYTNTHTDEYTHYTLILDLYSVLHPPLSTAVKVFLNSQECHLQRAPCTHTWTHTEEPRRLLSGLNHFTFSFKETV